MGQIKSIDYNYEPLLVKAWCEELYSSIEKLDIFKTSKIVCSINFNFKDRNSLNLKYKGINFSSRWRMLAPKTVFMYQHYRPYVNSKSEEFALYFINIDPGFFAVNEFLDFKQNFFFFFLHEFSHCIDLSNPRNVTLISNPASINNLQRFKDESNPNTQTLLAHNEQLEKEIWADSFALKLINSFYPNLNITAQSIAQFRQKEFKILGAKASSHYTSDYLLSDKAQEFISAKIEPNQSLALQLEKFNLLGVSKP